MNRGYQNFLSKYAKSSGEKVIFYQEVANYMFRNTNLLQDKPSDEKHEIITYYMDLLQVSGSSDAELFYAGLEQVKNYWNKTKIKSLAEYVLMRQNKIIVEKEVYQKANQGKGFKQNATIPKKQQKLIDSFNTSSNIKKLEGQDRRSIFIEKFRQM